MLTLFSVGLPLAAVGILAVLTPAWETLLNHFPAIETALEKVTAFNLFEIL